MFADFVDDVGNEVTAQSGRLTVAYSAGPTPAHKVCSDARSRRELATSSGIDSARFRPTHSHRHARSTISGTG